MPDDGEVLRGVILADAAEVFAERDIKHPVEGVLASMLTVFAEFERNILRDQVKAGIAQAWKEGRPHGLMASSGQIIDTHKAIFFLHRR